MKSVLQGKVEGKLAKDRHGCELVNNVNRMDWIEIGRVQCGNKGRQSGGLFAATVYVERAHDSDADVMY